VDGAVGSLGATTSVGAAWLGFGQVGRALVPEVVGEFHRFSNYQRE
jgi:hypothetical protein